MKTIVTVHWHNGLPDCGFCGHERVRHYQAGGCGVNIDTGDEDTHAWCNCRRYIEPEIPQARII